MKMSKKELERKHREEQEATAHAFQEFIKTFQDTSEPPNKTFVKSGILNSKTGEEIESQRGEIYNPKPFIKTSSSITIKNAIECARLLKEPKLERVKGQEKPKTNLEILKDELKLRHLERGEKNKITHDLTSCSLLSACDNIDTKTTNLFIAHVSAKVTENNLMQLFGAYGPLASVKIMWPRYDERSRTTHCGFVAFMSRKDAERAMQDLKDRDDMNIGWGKPIELPPNPIYIPPELLKLSLPPPSTGLPFNAQPLNPHWKTPDTEEQMLELLCNSVVKVSIPLDKKVLMTINRTIEFVIREGPPLEAMIMNREISNPLYQFLFDNQSPEHIYYRWKLYSMMQGETQKNWSMKPFRMFKSGSLWNPPIIRDYTKGMPKHLITKVDKKMLSDTQTNRLVQLIQTVTLSRNKIGEAMVFCLNHVDAIKDVVDVIVNSFMNEATKPPKKVARLYLLSDVLYNSSMKKCYAPLFRTEFEKHLIEIFKQLQITHKNLQMCVDQQALQRRVLNVVRSWDLWKIFPTEQLNKLENLFLNISSENEMDDESDTEPLDGANLIKRSLQNGAERNVQVSVQPVKQDLISAGFIPSKWEVIDPDEVKAQAMSTKKFYDMEVKRQLIEKNMQKKLTEEERELLRQVELMVMHYQDDVESGKIKLKKGITLERELDNFRNHLLYKMRKGREKGKKIASSDSSSDTGEMENHSKHKRYKKRVGKNRNNQRPNKRPWK